MKNQLFKSALAALLSVAFTAGLSAQDSVFTYQGRLNTNGAAYNGSAELQFTLWDAATNGVVLATNNPTSVIVVVENGLFTAPLDFGVNVFNGQPRFLQTEVRTVIGPFSTLSPRQPISAAPYALRALNLTTNGLAGSYGNVVTFDNAANSFAGGFAGVFTGVVNGDGAGLTNVNATTLGGLSSAGFWRTDGNGNIPANAFLGTTDNAPLELRVNNQRGWRLEYATNAVNYDSPNIIAGRSNNAVAAGVVGATISGGGRNGFGNQISADLGTIGGGYNNLIQGSSVEATIAGGSNHRITNSSESGIGGGFNNLIIGGVFGGGQSTIAGGVNNRIGVTNIGSGTVLFEGGHFIGGGNGNLIAPDLLYSAIGGGSGNTVRSGSATISGGQANVIQATGFASTVGGGFQNTNTGQYATIPGGDLNVAQGDYSFAAGRRAKANHQGAFVWADSQNADFASTANNQFLVRAAGGVGIGTTSPSRELEVQHSGDTEMGLKSTDANGHLWTIQSSSVNGGSDDASFQIIDRTLNVARFFIGTNGLTGIGTTSPADKLQVNGGITCTALTETSDRNAKEDFEPVSTAEVLAKVAALPMARWSFKELHDGRHLGPMAQDFYDAFHLGGSEKTITVVDSEGVALAAIQGLNEKVEARSQNAEVGIRELKEENAELKARLEKLELLLNQKLNRGAK